MSKASDVAYGRQGGRFTLTVKAQQAIEEMHRERITAIKRNEYDKDGQPIWPQHSIDMWRALARAENLDPDLRRRAREVDQAARSVGR